jgi:biopolymer transport protein ExbD
MRVLRMRDLSAESTFDLNLAPMMDMLVSIIPFMLLSATFLQLMLINVPLPEPIAKALAQDRAKTEREVSIQVNMDTHAGFLLEVKDEAGKVVKYTVPRAAGDYDYKALHVKLVTIKQQFPKVFRVELNPDETASYKTIVKIMDASRSMESADPKIKIENVDTPLLFPDVVLSNVMG